MNYWLITSTGTKEPFYSISEIFCEIERVVTRSPYVFRTRNVMSTIGESFSPEIMSIGSFSVSHNRAACINDNFRYRYLDDGSAYKEEFSHYHLATRNFYVITDIHGFAIPYSELSARYEQRYMALYASKGVRRNWQSKVYGYKPCKNRKKRLRKEFNFCNSLVKDHKVFTSKDEHDALVPVRAKRANTAKSTCVQTYDDYGYVRHSKSWKAKKVRKQWAK